MDITKLLADLSSQGVASFKGYGVELSFFPKSQQIEKQIDQPVVHKDAPSEMKQEQMPIDAGFAQSMDAELPYDKILNWSSSDTTDTPLTGDAQALTSEGI